MCQRGVLWFYFYCMVIIQMKLNKYYNISKNFHHLSVAFCLICLI